MDGMLMDKLKIDGWIIKIEQKDYDDKEIFYQTWEDVSSAIADEYLGCVNKSITITPITLVPKA